MRLRRMVTGLGMLFSSALIAGVFIYITKVDSIGGLAVTTLIAFLGGVMFMSGFGGRR